MSVSFASTDPQNLTLTPMRVTFDGTDLGGTLGNVVVSMKFGKADMKMDQLGETVVDRAVSSTEIKVTTELAEVLDMDKWKVAFPSIVEAASGGSKIAYWQSMIGDRDTAHAATLLLHPLSKVDADLSDDYLFYKAVAEEVSEITYGPTEQSKLKIVWNILPDFATQPARFFVHGNPAVGIVNASGGVTNFTGSGGGNISSLSTYNDATLTETITATCVTPQTNGGVFNVNGSSSGPLGLATVGIAFVSPVVSFTINDGSPDFALNDVFTITTIASNYV